MKFAGSFARSSSNASIFAARVFRWCSCAVSTSSGRIPGFANALSGFSSKFEGSTPRDMHTWTLRGEVSAGSGATPGFVGGGAYPGALIVSREIFLTLCGPLFSPAKDEVDGGGTRRRSYEARGGGGTKKEPKSDE